MTSHPNKYLTPLPFCVNNDAENLFSNTQSESAIISPLFSVSYKITSKGQGQMKRQSRDAKNTNKRWSNTKNMFLTIFGYLYFVAVLHSGEDS